MSGEANRAALKFIAEATWGTTPATPTMQQLRYTSESLNHNIDNIQSQEIRSDRNIADLVQAGASNAGSIEFELSYGTYDALLAAALFTTWETDTPGAGTDQLENGTTAVSFSIERAHEDIDEYFLFTGMMIDTLSLSVASGQIVTGSFGFVGSGVTLAQTTGATSTTAVTTTTPWNGMGNCGTIKEGGSALSGIYLQSINLNLSNNLRARNAIGQANAWSIGAGSCNITGSITAYFEDDSLYDKFLAGTETALEFTLTDAATNALRINLPRIKFTSDNVNSPGLDQDVMETINFQAMYDGTTEAAIQIERTPV